MNFDSYTTEQLRALTHIAKHKRRGVYPFFRCPKLMQTLRMELAMREIKEANLI